MLPAAAGRDAEAGDRLIQDQQDVVLASDLAQRLQVTGLGRDDAHVSHDPFADHGGDLAPIGIDRPLQRDRVVPRHDDRVLQRAPVEARAVGDLDRIVPVPQRHDRLRVGVYQKVVVPAVVVPLELDEAGPAGVAAGQADGGHRRLGAGVGEAHLLGARHRSLDQLGDLDLDLGGRGEQGALRRRFANRLHDARVRVSQRQRPIRHHPVDVLVAIDVVDAGARAALDEQRIVAVVGRAPRWRAAALHHHAQGALEQLPGFLGRIGHASLSLIGSSVAVAIGSEPRRVNRVPGRDRCRCRDAERTP